MTLLFAATPTAWAGTHFQNAMEGSLYLVFTSLVIFVLQFLLNSKFLALTRNRVLHLTLIQVAALAASVTAGSIYSFSQSKDQGAIGICILLGIFASSGLTWVFGRIYRMGLRSIGVSSMAVLVSFLTGILTAAFVFYQIVPLYSAFLADLTR